MDMDTSFMTDDSGNSDVEQEVGQCNNRTIVGYDKEPESESTGSSSEEELDNNDRNDLNSWCMCDNCTQLDSYRERICCQEIHACQERLDDATIHYGQQGRFDCITESPGFTRTCLQWEVLDIAWLAYKQQYGATAYNDRNNVSKRRRHVAYRQLARFLFGVVGRDNRYILPSCGVKKIRAAFPNDNPDNIDYTGFQYAN